MPFHLVKIKRGWKVEDDKGNFYSKHPLTKKRATAQLRALYASYTRGESIRGKGYATYCDEDDNHHIVLQGNGFFSDIFAKAKRVAQVVASKLTTRNLQAASDILSTGIRDDYPPDVRAVLEKYGQGQVYHLAIYRDPIKSYIDSVLNIISLGKWNAAKDKLNYDKMYHLSMVASLNMPNGDKADIKIEKNEVISITPKFTTSTNAEIVEVPVPCCFTLNELLNNAKQKMGASYFKYDAFANNCQAFILGILRANNLATPEVEQFVSQDALALAKELPEHVPAFASTLTNLAGFWNRLYKGQGKEFDARGTLQGGKIYCGMKKRTPPGYTSKGTTNQCFKKGVGVGMMLQEEKNKLTVDKLNTMSIRQLGQVAARAGVGRYSRMKKADLIAAITPHLATLNGAGRGLKGGADELPWNAPNQYAAFQISKAQQDAKQAERDKYKDVAGVGTKYDATDPYLDIAIGQRKQKEEAAQSLVKDSGIPDVPAWDDIPEYDWRTVPQGYTGFAKDGTYDSSKPNGGDNYGITYYKDGQVIRTGLKTGMKLKYDLGALRKQIESTWGNQFGGLHYLNNRNFTETNEQCMKDGTCQTYDENGNEKFNPNKHLSIDWLNSVEGRNARAINPALEEFYQRAKEQDTSANGLDATKRDKELEDKYQKEIEDRYDPNSDWITNMHGADITDQYNKTKQLHKARLRKDGGFDIQFTDGTWDYMPGENKWDCNAFMEHDNAENVNVCGTAGRAKAANQIETRIRTDRDKEWDNSSDWDKFVNGINVAGAVTQDYVLPIVSKVAGFIPGASFIGDIADLTGDITGAIQQGQCRHFNECTDQMVEQGKTQALYHDTVGDRVASRFFNDPTMAELANHNDKIIPLLQDTYQYGSRAGKLEATGEGKPSQPSTAFKKQLRQIGLTPEKYLEIAREIAEEEGYDPEALEFADDDEHKLMMYDEEDHKHKFGRVGYDDFITWSKKEATGKAPRGYAEQKRRVFNRSHSKLPGDWKKDKFSPNNLALRVLW